MTRNFIVVDDDDITNSICLNIIRYVFPDADVQIFTDPDAALLFIKSTYTKTNAPDAILLLDINMPTLTGWEFLSAFEDFERKVKDHIKIYMLSSSINIRDRERVERNKNVLDYIEKPLTRARLWTIS